MNYLNFERRSKTKIPTGDICKGTPDIEFERVRFTGLGSTFGDPHTDRQTHTDVFLKQFFYFRATLGMKEVLQSSKN